MAKTRAQRKAERRRRQQQAERQGQAGDGGAAARAKKERAQHDTQVPRSGEEAEFEAVMESGAKTEEYGERTVERDDQPNDQAGSPVPGVVPEPTQPEPPTPEPPAPSRADVGRPERMRGRSGGEAGGATRDMGAEAPPAPKESREERRARKEREKEERRKARAKELQKGQAEKAEKRRGAVTGFLASCWAELKRVQWPDRDTLVQASAVTFIFVAVMAAYLGALDAAFNWLVQRIL
jgi:preprotein translocase SecE subunit